MFHLCFGKRCRWKSCFLLIVWRAFLSIGPSAASGSFLGDTKAVFNGCEDQWTLQGRGNMPQLSEMTVCVDVRVVVPGHWVAFSYGSIYAPNPDLGLEGDNEAIYGWLLQVRHRFPLQLSQAQWHRVCLRRDINGNIFNLEVDGRMVAERTVISQAIPSAGSVWLGCGPKNRLTGVKMGKVELYLFRMWADLGIHGFCEDGNVIGWNAQQWGVTSSKAKETDPYLLCDHKRIRRHARLKERKRHHGQSAFPTGQGLEIGRMFQPGISDATGTNSSPPANNQFAISTKVPPVTTRPNDTTFGPTRINCESKNLCSDKSAYYLMSIDVVAENAESAENQIQILVSEAFGCHSDDVHGDTNFIGSCLNGGQHQAVKVNCRGKNESWMSCNVVVQISPPVSACDLQIVAESMLPQTERKMKAKISGQIQRIGLNECGSAAPSNRTFVSCNSLEDVCQLEQNVVLNCSTLELNSHPPQQVQKDSCKRNASQFCSCTAFCNTSSQFYAIRINITNSAFNVNTLGALLLQSQTSDLCTPTSDCKDYLEIFQKHRGTHIECRGTQQRLYGCMVTLEMSGPVNTCSLNTLVQAIIKRNSNISAVTQLTQMIVCGPSDWSVVMLLHSNLTWVSSGLQKSDICQPDHTVLQCKGNETLAVLLTDSCSLQSPTLSTTRTPQQTVPLAPQSTSSSETYTTPKALDTSSIITTAKTTTTNSHKFPVTPPNNTSSDYSKSTTMPNPNLTQTFTPGINRTLETMTTVINYATTQSPSQTTTGHKTLETNAITLTPNYSAENNIITLANSPKTATHNLTTVDPGTTTINNLVPNITNSIFTFDANYTALSNTISLGNKFTQTEINSTVNHTAWAGQRQMFPSDATASTVLNPGNSHQMQSEGITPASVQTTTHETFTATNQNTSEYNSASNIINTTTVNTTLARDDFKSSLENRSATNYATNYTHTDYSDNENSISGGNNDTKAYNETIETSHAKTLNNNFTTQPTTLHTDSVVTFRDDNLTTTKFGATTTGEYKTQNNLMASNRTVDSATAPSNKYTTKDSATQLGTTYVTMNNKTTSDGDYANENIVTTPNNNNTTMHKATPKNNNTMVGNTNSNVTIVENVTTPSSNFTTLGNVTIPIINYTEVDYVTPPSVSHVTVNNTTTVSNDTMRELVTTPTNNYYTTGHSETTPNRNETKVDNATPPKIINPTEFNSTTPGNNYTVINNPPPISTNTTMNRETTTRINNYTTQHNATIPSENYTPNSNYTTLGPARTQSHDATTISKTPNSNYSTMFSATTVGHNYTTVSKIFSFNNITTGENTTIPTNNYTTTSSNLHKPINGTPPSMEFATVDNAATPTIPHSTKNNTRPSELFVTVMDATTPSQNHITEANAITPNNNFTLTGEPTSSSSNYTTVAKANMPTSKYTTLNNPTTPSSDFTPSHMSNHPIPTSGNHTIAGSMSTASNASTSLDSVTTPRNNYTSVDNQTPHSINHTTVNSASTPKNKMTSESSPTPTSYTTINNTTLPGMNHTNFSATTPSGSFAKINDAMMPISIHPTLENVATVSKNPTTPQGTTRSSFDNITTPNKITPSHNLSLPDAQVTRGSNLTTHPDTTLSENLTKPTEVLVNNQMVMDTTESLIAFTTVHKNNISTTKTLSNADTTNAPRVNLSTTGHTTIDHAANTPRTNNSSSISTENGIKSDEEFLTSTTTLSTTLEITSTTATSSTTAMTASTAMTATTTFMIMTTTTTLSSTTTSKALSITTASTTATTSKAPTTTTASITTATTTDMTTFTTNTPKSTADANATTMLIVETTPSNTSKEANVNLLLNKTMDPSQLTSSQVAECVGILEKGLEGPVVSHSLGQKMIEIINNLMDTNSTTLLNSSSRLIKIVDDLGVKLDVKDEKVLSTSSVVLAIKRVDGTNFSTMSVDIMDTETVQFHFFSKSQVNTSGSALASVYMPSSLTSGLSPEKQLLANRVQFSYFSKNSLFQDVSLNDKILVSPVLGSSVANLSLSNLRDNVTFTIGHFNLTQTHASACVFWDFDLNESRGGWKSDGCLVVSGTAEFTTCSCNHLTSFAILLDLSRNEKLTPQNARILTFITYIGCGISSVLLAVTLLTYVSFQKLLRDIPAKILVQLCLSLFLLNLVFLLNGWLALQHSDGLCISTAFFLHYFLLTSFTWAGLEALHMYLSIVRVFTPYLSRYMLKFTLMGWGIPLAVVIVVISVDKSNYGLVTYGENTTDTSDDFCWLTNKYAFYVSVVAYFLLIFILCLLVFIVVMVQLYRIKKQNPQNQAPNRTLLTDLRSFAGLVILLGLTWGFALFAWGPLYLPFIYLFSIFNSLQGFFIFIFHCAVKENVRRQWRTYLCCGKLRLAENSDWSRTATNYKNQSVLTTLKPDFASRSSSYITDLNNSSDSGISDSTYNGVVFNEIHRRTMTLSEV